jgi:hypothetical protein
MHPRLLPHEADPLFAEINGFNHPTRIHPGDGFNLGAWFLISPPVAVCPRGCRQGVSQDLIDALERQSNLILTYRQGTQVLLEGIVIVSHRCSIITQWKSIAHSLSLSSFEDHQVVPVRVAQDEFAVAQGLILRVGKRLFIFISGQLEACGLF